MENNWTRIQGLRGRLQGELTTVGDNRASVHLEALLDSTTSLGFNLRQEVKGGDFRWHNQP